MQKYTPVSFEINLRSEGLVFDVGSLFEALLALHDQRDARGIRYALVTVWVLARLAKLAGEDYLRGIAQWVAERKAGLAEVLSLAKPQAPCYTTYGRILGHAVVLDEFTCVVHDFLFTCLGRGTRSSWPSTARRCGARFRRGRPVGCICWRRICPGKDWR
jgi:hypothetical protein